MRLLFFESNLPIFEKLILNEYFTLKRFGWSDIKIFGLDKSSIKVEKFTMKMGPAKGP